MLKDWRDVVFEDPPMPTANAPETDARGVWDDEEFEAWRREVLSTPLP